MKNKNPLYIVFGIGAGIVAYYLFCKKKDGAVALADGQADGQADDNTPTRGAILGGNSVTPQNATLVPIITPLVLNGTPTFQGKPPITIINTNPTDISNTPRFIPTKVVPRPVPISTTVKVVPRPVPISTTVKVVPRPVSVFSRPMTSISSRFNGFDGSSFEVGDCLNDL